MNTPRYAVLAALLSCIGCAPSRPAETTAPLAPAALDSLFAEFDSAWNAHDATRLSELFVADGDCVTPGGKRAAGRAALTEMFASPGPTKATISSSHVDSVRRVGPDLAFVSGSQTLTGPGVEQMGSSRGSMVGLVRQLDGRWRFVEVHAFAMPEPRPRAAHE